ncbi:MAG: signal peptidase I [Tissierellia bacterium]|nr:signal peptidase I [Tissierellia bacterium]
MKENKIISFLKELLIVLLIALFIRNFIFNIAQVKGISMEPTLHENDKLICLAYQRFFPISSGKIVVIKAPGEKKKFVKRVVATPGDIFEIQEGKVYINGKEQDESYTSTDTTLPLYLSPIQLKDNEYFVLGDNRLPGASEDSRYFGPLEKSDIKAVVYCRFLPFQNFRRF